MSTPRIRLGADDGVAMYLVMMVMMVLLTLGAALSLGGHQSSLGVSNDELGGRALQAAEAGAQVAVHRLNMQQPKPTECIQATIAYPQSGSIWCAATSSETVASNATYSYQVSTEGATGCTGSAFGSGLVERCVVAVGSAAGITRRVVQRVVSSSGAAPFPVNGILGRDSIDINNNTNAATGLGTNGSLTIGSGSTITGGVTLWQNAPAPVGYSGPVTRQPTPFVLSPPNMVNPETMLDSASSNYNWRLVNGASPADSCAGGNGPSNACYVDSSASPRTLSVGNGGSVTLGGGVYNFCQLNLGNNAAVNIASGAFILIYIDSPDRGSVSGCKSGQGGVTSGNGTVITNPTGDPRALQLVVYGSSAYPTLSIPNNAAFSAAIYAPNTGITFKNNGNFNGAISAKSVSIKNNATWDSRLTGFRLATTLVYYRGSWRQCSSRSAAPALAPTTGCL